MVVRTHRAIIGFSLKVNFDDAFSVPTRNSKAAVKLSDIVQHIVNFSLVKQEQRSRGRKQ